MHHVLYEWSELVEIDKHVIIKGIIAFEISGANCEVDPSASSKLEIK